MISKEHVVVIMYYVIIIPDWVQVKKKCNTEALILFVLCQMLSHDEPCLPEVKSPALYFNHESRSSLSTMTMEPSNAGECAACVKVHQRAYCAYIKKVVTFCKQGFCSVFCIIDNLRLASLYETKF